MKWPKIQVLILLLILFVFICTNEKRSNIKSEISFTSIDKTEIKIETDLDSLSKWGKKELELQDFEIVGDTLSFISADFYFYYPYGKFKTIDSIRLKYPFLKLELQIDDTNGYKEKLYKMKFRNSFVKFVYSEETGRIEIVHAEIHDKHIIQLRGIRVGLSKSEFFSEIFIRPVVLDKINNVKIISALDGIIHHYHFRGDSISSIILDTDYLLYKY